ncbi:MAG: hypothetical protein NC914_00060 [Candidatus Omnitrophica bacterium]|nr:hypothetical protein [Candidatus Omnitrophota bacterium]
MQSKKGWSALEYLIMTTAIVIGLIAGAATIKSSTTNYLEKIGEKIANTVNN